MGQKVNPIGFRVGIMEGWKSRWYASKQEFSSLLFEDQKLRRFIKEKYRFAGIPKVEIERTRDEVKVILFTARPGIIIGRKGQEVERLQDELQDAGRPADQHQDRGNRPPRVAGPAGRRGHRRSARQAGQLPPLHEEGDGNDDGGRSQGNQDSTRRPAGRRRNGPPRKVDRRLDPALDAAGERSITGSPKPPRRKATLAFRCGSIKACITRSRPMALMPKRVKHRKSQRGRIRGNATRGNRVVHGEFALQATQGGWLSAQPSRPGVSPPRSTCATRGGSTFASSHTNRSPRFRWKREWEKEKGNRSSGPP